jgi:hypothetical protein
MIIEPHYIAAAAILVIAMLVSLRHLRLFAIFLVLTAVFTASSRAMELLDAIAMVESGGNDLAVGANGEVSRYQILPSVWRQYDASRRYGNRWVARAVARKHLDYLANTYRLLRHTGSTASNLDLAIMWNCGIGAYRRAYWNPEMVNPATQDHARRIVNLLESSDKSGGKASSVSKNGR